jgi:hypothetical protein
MRYQWHEIKYEGDLYDVCLDTKDGIFLDEIRVHDSEVDIRPVMDEKVMDWMLKRAIFLQGEPKLHTEETCPAGLREEAEDWYLNAEMGRRVA